MHPGRVIIPILCLINILNIDALIPSQHLSQSSPYLETVKQWNLLSYNFQWDSPADNTNYYNPTNVVATGIAVDSNRHFVATPRLFSGVPATLSTIPHGNHGDSPVLRAYPDWSHHTISLGAYNCSDIGLISVYRVRIDSCNRLWALDAGVSRSLEDFEITCPPKILVYDLNTDQVVRRIDFPDEVIQRQSLFTNIIVDETRSRPGGDCDDVFVYITDTVAPAIIVYDSENDFTWRLSHPAMFPDPNFSVSRIDGYEFTLKDGVVGLAFDPNSRTVYFQPLATDRLFSVSTAALQAGPLDRNVQLPVKLVGKKSSQGIGLAVSPRGSIFFSPFTETAIAEWNPVTNTQTVIAYDPDQLQFGADLRIPNGDPSFLYILTSRFHRFFLKNVNINEFNTRILRVRIGGSPLNPQHSLHGGSNLDFGIYQPQPHRFKPIASPYVGSSYTSHSLGQTSSIKPSDFVQGFINSLKPHPYQYEAVGIINKNIHNPFSSLNTGENPHYYGYHGHHGHHHHHHHHRRSNSDGYPRKRYTKNAPLYNATTIY